MKAAAELRRILGRIDGRGYRAYREIRDTFDFSGLRLHVDHVQADPFAAPSRVRVEIPHSEARIPEALHSNATRRVALEDHLARRVRDAIRAQRQYRRGSGKSGEVRIDAGGQEVIERTAVRLGRESVEVRLEVGLPAAGRRVLGFPARKLLCDTLPHLATQGLHAAHLDEDEAREFVECVENQEHLRDQLEPRGLLAFVADGSMLARESGASDRPMADGASVPFVSPQSLRTELSLLHPTPGGEHHIAGMGIPRGVTLIVGGGYHGKSTLLHALERAVYPHIPGDGREAAVSARDLVKIRAEDGRRVSGVDISAFVGALPQGRDTSCFNSDDASGSTSQAANIIEALEAGARGLLLDEDTCATNFMIRDARMQALVAAEHEPITPFVERVRELYDVHGVSTVLVMGGCGDYFEAADCVVEMRDFLPRDATEAAARIATQRPSERHTEATRPFSRVAERIPLAQSLDPSRGRRDVVVDARSVQEIGFGSEVIDLWAVEQLVDRSQTRAVGIALYAAAQRWMDENTSLSQLLDRLEAFFDDEGLDALDPRRRPGLHPGNLARPRRFEVAAALNRLRSLRAIQKGDDTSC